ncbi:MAG: enoyl-CoA hydratase/isomerase family protein, partial [Burkholderiales bacterium]
MVASTRSAQLPLDGEGPLVVAERIDAALVIRINRPDAGNAVSHDVALAMRAHVDAAANDPSLSALVLTGAGTRYFCSGGDLKAYALIESPDELNRIFGTIRDTLDALEALDIPVIAAVNGFALGGGAEILLACDVRVAEESARIGFPQSRLGLLP